MRTALIVILVPLVSALAAALLGYVLRPRSDDAMPRAISDAPRFPRGGYAALGEREPITNSRARSLGSQHPEATGVESLRGRAGAGSEV
jgi:hypothetical protein